MSSVERRRIRRREQDSRVSHTARIIVGALILTTCITGNDFAFVAQKSDGRDVPKEPPFYSPEWHATEHLVTVENLRVHYIESGTGPAVVMIHGNAGTVGDFEFGAVQLLPRDYKVVPIDRPLPGRSEIPPENPPTAK